MRVSSASDLALLRVDVTQVLHHLERAALGPGDVHVHPHVVLARHHLGGASRTLRDPGVVERRDDVLLVQRAGFVDGRLPELERPVRSRARTPRGEHRAPGVQPLVPVEELDAERIVDRPVVVETPVQTFDVVGRNEVQEVLVEVGADDDPAPTREAGAVQLLEERREPGRDDRVEHDLGARRHDVVDDPLVVGVIEREVLLADDLAAFGRDDLTHLLVHRVRPDVVGRRHVEAPRPGLLASARGRTARPAARAPDRCRRSAGDTPGPRTAPGRCRASRPGRPPVP